MTANSSLIILLVLYLTAVTHSPNTVHEFTLILEEVNNAISKMNLTETTKDAFSIQHINVGYYSSNFIELLDSLMTLQKYSTRFNIDEKKILTSTSTEEPNKIKIRTQMKYYSKMQEVQCTDYFILYYNLYNTDRILKYGEILQHIFNMIEMAYLGKFVVVPLLWNLYIRLTSFYSHINNDNFITEKLTDRDLKQYQEPLGELVNMCMKDKYITQTLNCINEALQNISCPKIKIYINTILKHNNDKTHKHFNYNINKSQLPLSIDNLFLETFNISFKGLEPITKVTIDWNWIRRVFGDELVLATSNQTVVKNYFSDPFKLIEFQKMFLDILRVKLYCFILVQLSVYQKVDRFKYRERHYAFMRLIFGIVELIHIEDKSLNQVLTLYSEIKDSNLQQIEEVLEIMTNEVNNILKTFGVSETTKLVDISDINVENEDEFNSFLVKIEEECQEFGNIFKTTLAGFSYDFLLFFINGSNNTDFTIFPKYCFAYIKREKNTS